MLAQGPQLAPRQGVSAWRAVLCPTDVQGRGFEIDLLPTQIHDFGRPEAMPVGQEHH